MKSRACIYTSPIKGLKTYLDVIDVAVEFGLENVETINSYELREPNVEFAKQMHEYADKKGVRFPCVSVGLNLVGDNGPEMIEKMKKYADVAKALGSPYLHHTIALECRNPKVIEENRSLFYKRGLEAVRTVFDYAAEIGIRTVYEDQGYLFNGVQGFGQFLSDVDREVGVVADFGNILFVDEGVESFIPTFADRIVNVHIKDYIVTPHEGERDPKDFYSWNGNLLQDCAFGKGSVNMEKGFAELKKIGYKGTFAMECPPLGEDPRETLRSNIALIDHYVKKMEE